MVKEPMECYFDNSATTRCYESVKEIMIRTMMTDYGNPSSMHKKGVDAENYVKDARDILAKNLKVNAKEIFFTSGGTEGNNLAIIGTAMANRRSGNHVITSAVEHPSVTAAMEYLEENGFRARPDEFGRIREYEANAAIELGKRLWLKKGCLLYTSSVKSAWIFFLQRFNPLLHDIKV